jgi:hypothetical protein
MDQDYKVGIMDADDGVGVVVYGKLHGVSGYGCGERRFPSREDAYRAMSQEIAGITPNEMAALYTRTGAEVLSRPPGDPKDWAAFFKHTIS